ncbi:disease resistance protein RUN1-like [Cornus florida]|uniref:disease resistance protein RUN1-like n=1 Tax=Cornus florida TaxID=4283 RepID=UPI0028998966|nr:disease resistance protein RUN1-like [Cornus florida]
MARFESTLIEKVVGEVADKLNHTHLSVTDHLVGIDFRVQKLSGFLKLRSNNDVRIVAIWGIGGIGKTTVAKALFNRMHRTREFEGSSFLRDVRETSMQPNGFVLLVLDDVDNIRQLRALAINRDLLRPGSRVILTIRDLSSTTSLQVDKVYKIEELNEDESFQLFSWHAFRRDRPVEDYKSLSKEVVSYSKGLPLVLEILGSHLSSCRDILEWRSELEKLRKFPHKDVQGKLTLSFNSLDDKLKVLFLHIACFFVGMDQDLSIKILKGCGFFPESEIGVLSRRFLVTIDGYNRLMMHDHIKDKAREIVRQESPEEPGERSRLWH